MGSRHCFGHSFFGIAATYEDTTFEKEHLGCLRMAVKGTRSVALAGTLDVHNFMKGKGEAQDKLNPKLLKSFYKKIGGKCAG